MAARLLDERQALDVLQVVWVLVLVLVLCRASRLILLYIFIDIMLVVARIHSTPAGGWIWSKATMEYEYSCGGDCNNRDNSTTRLMPCDYIL